MLLLLLFCPSLLCSLLCQPARCCDSARPRATPMTTPSSSPCPAKLSAPNASGITVAQTAVLGCALRLSTDLLRRRAAGVALGDGLVDGGGRVGVRGVRGVGVGVVQLTEEEWAAGDLETRSEHTIRCKHLLSTPSDASTPSDGNTRSAPAPARHQHQMQAPAQHPHHQMQAPAQHPLGTSMRKS